MLSWIVANDYGRGTFLGETKTKERYVDDGVDLERLFSRITEMIRNFRQIKISRLKESDVKNLKEGEEEGEEGEGYR